MFCMNCGQVLPDGAKFCLACGTPQGAVSPVGSVSSERVNLDGKHTFVPAQCPNCNAHMKVDSLSKIARCDTCGTECLVQDAIKTLTVSGSVQVGVATINVNGTNNASLLHRAEMLLADGDFSGAMLKCDTILDSDPTNGNAFFLMLMSSLKCRSRSDLANQPVPFDRNQYYIKAIQYGDGDLKAELERYINEIKARQRALKVGDIILFGNANGQRIGWNILKKETDAALIIAANNVCNMPYHQPGGNITWSNCTLREWLNTGFYNRCFAQAEQVRIQPRIISNDNNPQYKTAGGDPTTDRIFLLSINEAVSLFANYQERANGSSWWLRSPGIDRYYAAGIDVTGRVLSQGSLVRDFLGVRPALWLSFNP